MDFYKVLGIESNSDLQTIKKAYKKLALKYHPDRNPDNKEVSEQKFKQISEAFQVLSDPELRKKYDLYGNVSNNSNESHFQNPFSLFEQLFTQQRNRFNIPSHFNLFKDNNQTYSQSFSFSSSTGINTNYQSTKTETIFLDGKYSTKITESYKLPNGKIKTKVIYKNSNDNEVIK